ncbi:MAG TPA: hypothetical protein VL992_00755 [Tepidisphaeraceae bacterium]|nr:hypothetical protein [Tepidisphaeraceae bacterium]
MKAPSQPMLDRRDGMVLLALVGGLVAVYSSVVMLHYAFLDDYSWLDLSLYSPGEVYPGLAAQGRPLNGMIMRLAFQLAGGIDGMRWVRAATVAGLGVMGWMLYLAASRAGWGRPQSALLAGIACVLPPMQIYAAWTTCIPLPIAGTLAAAAAMLTGWAMSRRQRWPFLLIPPICLTLSAAIYQPMTLLFCPVAALELFRPKDDANWAASARRGLIYAVVGAAGLVGGWGVYKYGVIRYASLVSPDRNGFTLHPMEKITGFLGTPMVDSLNFFRIEPNEPIASIVGVTIIIGLLCYFRGPIAFRLTMLLAAIALAPISYAPCLLTKATEWCYRTQIALDWMLLVLLWLAINGLWRLVRPTQIPVTLLAAVALIGGGLAADHTTALIAWPQTVELSLLRTQLARPDVQAARRIFLLQPGWSDDPTKIHRYDEFGVPSLMAPWVPYAEIHLIRCESNPNPPRFRVKRIAGFQGPWTAPLPPGAALIDMRVLRFAR